MTRSLGSLAHSLANLFHDRSQTMEYRLDHGHDDPDYLPLTQGHSQARPKTRPHAPAPSQSSHSPDAAPTRQEVLNYLG
jgi:hypothetical protein